MSGRQYVHLRAGLSWHIVATPTRLINGYRTLCGRLVVGYPVDALPDGQRMCKRCSTAAEKAGPILNEWTAP
jgi:hypothetical protein